MAKPLWLPVVMGFDVEVPRGLLTGDTVDIATKKE
jgi:hypothetical protein